MANVHIALTAAPSLGNPSHPTPVAPSRTLASKKVASSAVAADVDITADREGVWYVTAIDGDVWVTFDPEKDAAVEVEWLVLAGTTRDFGARAGDKPSLIDA
jgi:hypothetical protein